MPSATNSWADEVGPPRESGCGAIDHRPCLVPLVWVTRFDRNRDDRTPRPEVGEDQLPAIAFHQGIEGIDTARRLGDSGGDMLARVIDCLT